MYPPGIRGLPSLGGYGVSQSQMILNLKKTWKRSALGVLRTDQTGQALEVFVWSKIRPLVSSDSLGVKSPIANSWRSLKKSVVFGEATGQKS
jgi:hypothetical protein